MREKNYQISSKHLTTLNHEIRSVLIEKVKELKTKIFFFIEN